MSKDWSRERWRRLYLRESAQQRACWALMTRGIRDYVVRLAEDDGTLVSDAGEQAFDVLIRVLRAEPDEEALTRAACAVLLADGYLAQEDGRIWVAGFDEMQRDVRSVPTAKCAAERQRDFRRRRLRFFLEIHGDRCRYCGRRVDLKDPCGHRGATRDHIKPRCQGGGDEPDNLVLACRSCNSRKGGRTPEEAGMVMQ